MPACGAYSQAFTFAAPSRLLELKDAEQSRAKKVVDDRADPATPSLSACFAASQLL